MSHRMSTGSALLLGYVIGDACARPAPPTVGLLGTRQPEKRGASSWDFVCLWLALLELGGVLWATLALAQSGYPDCVAFFFAVLATLLFLTGVLWALGKVVGFVLFGPRQYLPEN